MTTHNSIPHMGRKKHRYSAPEGLIRHPGSPFWYIKIGNICKSTKTSDLARATIILREVQKRLLEKQLTNRAKEVCGDSITFSMSVHRYHKEVSPTKKSARADKTNASYPLKFFGDTDLNSIRPKDIYKYHEWRRKQYANIGDNKNKKKDDIELDTGKRFISGSTINRERAFISSLFQKAVEWGYVEHNPVRGTKGFAENKRDRYIEDKEFEAIKEVARQEVKAAHLADIMEVLYLTGQRSGKILTLKWSQINLEERKITFGNGSSTKRVPDEIWINQRLFEVLGRLKRKRSLYPVVGPYVFQKRDGKPYATLKTTWKTCCRKAGINGVRIHDIRHKTLTDMGKKGYSLQMIAKAGGHRNISTTMRYTHLRAEDTMEAFESLCTVQSG